MALASRPPAPRAKEKPTPIPLSERRETVFLPPAAVLRQLLPPSVQPRHVPPPPTPPPSNRKDRVSVGAPSDERAKGPLLLRREDDLTAVPKGKPNAVPSPPPS